MATRLLTADDLWTLPHNQQYDLIQGVLHTMPFAGWYQGLLTSELSCLIHEHAEAHCPGIMFAAETGFLLGRDPDTVMGPDIAYIRADRVSPWDHLEGFGPVAPDLVVECIPSPDDRSELMIKVDVYLSAGVADLWLVDLENREITVFRSNHAPQVVARDGVLGGGDVLPGFALPLWEIFSDD